MIGLEPTRRKTPDPKSGASTNFATRATVFNLSAAKVVQKTELSTLLLLFFAVIFKNKGFGFLYYCVAAIVPILACDVYFYIRVNAEFGVLVVDIQCGAG